MESSLNSLYPNHLSIIQAHHDKALANSEFDALVIPSGQLIYHYQDDMAQAFRTSPLFLWWLPLANIPNCYLVIKPQQKPLLLFHQPRDYWHHVADIPTEFYIEHFEVYSFSTEQHLKSLLAEHCKSRSAWLGDERGFPVEVDSSLVNPSAIINSLHYARAYKTAYEQGCLQVANQKSLYCHEAVKKAFFEGASTYEMRQQFMQVGGVLEHELPYTPIIGVNESAAILHFHAVDHRNRLSHERRSLLVDAGLQYRGYAADITRTYAESKDDFSALIKRMDRLQQTVCKALAVGKSFEELHQYTHQLLSEVLVEAELVHVDTEEAITTGLTRCFFPHGLGHLLGLQVHDIGGKQISASGEIRVSPKDHPSLRCTRMLEQDMVLTIEPGLYFIEQLLRSVPNQAALNHKRIASLKPYGGIRIEDNVVITKDSYINLTRKVSK